MKLTKLIVFILLPTLLYSQDFEWVKTLGGITIDEGKSICVDDFGYIYIAGTFQGNVDFDPGVGTEILSSVGGTSDIFVMKVDSLGNFIWVKSFEGTAHNSVESISIDNSGNIYTTGYFSQTIDFDSGTGIANSTSIGGWDIFVHKMNNSGDFLWAKSFGGSTNDTGLDITIDLDGNVYTTGFFTGSVDFDPSSGNLTLISSGNADFFVHKMDSLGNFLWAKSFGGNGNDRGYSISIDNNNDIITTGYFNNTVDFDPSNGVYEISSTGSFEAFIHKMDSLGNFLWVKSFGGTSDDRGYSIAVDNSNNIYTTGYFKGTVDFDPSVNNFNVTSVGNSDFFIHKLDNLGNFLWVKSFGSSSFDVGYTIVVDLLENIYTTGVFQETIDFDPGVGVANLSTSLGSAFIFLQKLDSSGNFLWAKAFGNSENQSINSSLVDNSGNIYSTGYFYGTLDFDPSANTYYSNSAGNKDIFIQKINQNTLGLEQEVNDNQLKIFPNPSKGLIQILFQDTLYNTNISLTDITGKIIYEKQFDIISNTQIEIIGQSGIYFLKIDSPNYKSVIKIIKE